MKNDITTAYSSIGLTPSFSDVADYTLGENYSLMRTSMMPTVLQSITTNFNKKNKNVNNHDNPKKIRDNNFLR